MLAWRTLVVPLSVRTIDAPDATVQKGKRLERPRKTGRPGA
jgi:hypothetical protein